MSTDGSTTFLYDALDRCIEIQDAAGTKKLLYQGKQEIGSIMNDRLHEFRLTHPEQEHTFAIELEGKLYFPIQDAHFNICALQNMDGSLAQRARYSAFGEQKIAGDFKLTNPWRYANHRKISGLVLFAQRSLQSSVDALANNDRSHWFRRWLEPLCLCAQ